MRSLENRTSPKRRGSGDYGGLDVARIDVDCPVKLLFDREELDGGRKRGAQRKRWGDQFKEDLTQITNLADWREAAQDRGRWRNLLATASERRVAN